MHSIDHEAAWNTHAQQWQFPTGVTYLNHGSFGPSPRVVREAARTWTEQLERNPMEFFVRRLAPLLDEARQRLAKFVGTSAENLVYVDNATAGMNAVAASVALKPGDEVLTTDHDYGAVVRIWERACRRAGAKLVIQPVPLPVESPESLIERVLAGVTPRTRLLVFSHITSPTALIFPAEALCRAARERGLRVCIDGPHAIAMLPLELDRLDCDYYTASCHKWLSGPFGSGFLYVHPRVQAENQPAVMSWGRFPPEKQTTTWADEFTWVGTCDPAAYLAVPTAIDFLSQTVGLAAFRQRTHYLASLARRQIGELTGLEPLSPDAPDWYGSMIALPLSDGSAEPLQQALWQRHGIEIPVVPWNNRRLIRVSCHLYNQAEHITRLVDALREEVRV